MTPILLLVFAGLQAVTAHSWLELYTLTDSGGAMMNTSDYLHNLDDQGFNNMVKSVCGRGVWLLYEDRDMNGHSENDFQHWTELMVFPTYTCHNLPSTHHDELTSIRYVGTGDIDDETMSLYHGYHWNGGELLLLKDEDSLSDMDNQASSMIITGSSGEAWTLYSEDYYGGIAICVYPWPVGNNLYVGSYEVDDVGLPNNVLASVRKGCHSETVYGYHPQ